MSAGDFVFLRHFLTCLSFVKASVWLGGGSDGLNVPAMPNLMTEQICLETLAVVL